MRHLVSTVVAAGALAAAGLAGAQTDPLVVCSFPANAKPAIMAPARIGTPVRVGQRVLMVCRTVSGRPLARIVGSVTDSSPNSITVAGVTCAVPANTKPAVMAPVRIGSNLSCRVQVKVVGSVTAVTDRTVTVAGVTCAFPANTKPAIMAPARIGNHVLMACGVRAGQLNVTKLLKR